MFRVDFVERGEVGHVRQEARGLDDVLHGETGGGEDGFDVSAGLLGLFGDGRAFDLAACRVDAELAGEIEKFSGANGLGVGADGGRGVFGMNRFHKILL